MQKNYKGKLKKVFRAELLLVILLLGTFSSCAGLKRKKSTVVNKPVIVTDETLIKMEEAAFQFESLSIQARANYTEGESNQSFTMSIRMKKDSLIWISVSGLGFEVVRALLNKDSIYVLDRFNRVYYAYGKDQAHQLLGVQVELIQLQAILLGNAPYPWKSYKMNSADSAAKAIEYREADIYNKLYVNSLHRLSGAFIKNMKTGQDMNIEYSKHTKVDKMYLPYSSRIEVNAENSRPILTLSYEKVTLDQTHEFPFSIPPNYKKAG